MSPWCDGYEAGMAGAPVLACPYFLPTPTPERQLPWLDGWASALIDRGEFGHPKPKLEMECLR